MQSLGTGCDLGNGCVSAPTSRSLVKAWLVMELVALRKVVGHRLSKGAVLRVGTECSLIMNRGTEIYLIQGHRLTGDTCAEPWYLMRPLQEVCREI